MVKVGTLLGGEANSTRHQMEEVFQLEKKLAEIYEPKERLRDMEKIYHKMTVAELQQLAPAVRRSEPKRREKAGLSCGAFFCAAILSHICSLAYCTLLLHSLNGRNRERLAGDISSSTLGRS